MCMCSCILLQSLVRSVGRSASHRKLALGQTPGQQQGCRATASVRVSLTSSQRASLSGACDEGALEGCMCEQSWETICAVSAGCRADGFTSVRACKGCMSGHLKTLLRRKCTPCSASKHVNTCTAAHHQLALPALTRSHTVFTRQAKFRAEISALSLSVWWLSKAGNTEFKP